MLDLTEEEALREMQRMGRELMMFKVTSPTEWRIVAVIKALAGPDGWADFTYAELASLTALSTATVAQHMKALKNDGLLEVRTEARRGPAPLRYYRVTDESQMAFFEKRITKPVKFADAPNVNERLARIRKRDEENRVRGKAMSVRKRKRTRK